MNEGLSLAKIWLGRKVVRLGQIGHGIYRSPTRPAVKVWASELQKPANRLSF